MRVQQLELFCDLRGKVLQQQIRRAELKAAHKRVIVSQKVYTDVSNNTCLRQDRGDGWWEVTSPNETLNFRISRQK